MRHIAALIVLSSLVLSGCRNKDDTGDSADFDVDNDGFTLDVDCDDNDPNTYPDAVEICDDADNDCDQLIDEGAGSALFIDADLDGFGDPALTEIACEATAGLTADGTDCDDSNDAIHPDADEICDGADNDCDGLVDDEDGSLVDAPTWYADGDKDGWGQTDYTATACEAPPGYSALDGDCNDADGDYYPGAPEDDCTDPNDYNCDDAVGYEDGDDDGYAACEECDDSNADVNPAATEICDTIDNNCDGSTDGADAVDASTWWADTDQDGFGDIAVTALACDVPEGFADNSEDCDDSSDQAYPGGTEVCDTLDNDCNGKIDDDAADATTWYADSDGDSHGTPDYHTEACEAPTDYVATALDCDDTDGAVNPDASEVCDGVDNNCDGSTDEDTATDAETWYLDQDGDGYGDPTDGIASCSELTGRVDNGEDCDDSAAAVHPGATNWYPDDDSDGYGDDSAVPNIDCLAPSGYTHITGDCDDDDSSINPGITEICDGIDNNCDGDTDGDATDAETYYADLDGDSYGDPDSTAISCTQPALTVTDSGDCDDSDSTVNPDAAEVCDGADTDCNGTVDDAPDGDGDGYGECDDCDDGDKTISPDLVWYYDGDGDGYGDSASSTTACEQPSNYVENSDDCLPSDSASYPGAEETCGDGVDNNCDGEVDEACPIEHCGYISADETWEANEGGHVVTCAVYVSDSKAPVLTIEDGATVYFQPGTILYVGYPGYGDLRVEGTSSGVTFTSDAASPAPGDYYGLYLYKEASSATDIEGLTIEYAGQGAGALYMYLVDPEVRDSTIRYSGSAGMYLYYAEPTITGTEISDNDGTGIECYNATCIDETADSFADNTITGNGGYPITLYANSVAALDSSNSFTGNALDAIHIRGGTVVDSSTWHAQDVPYLIDVSLYVQSSTKAPTLTIEDGAELQFDGVSLYIGTSYSGNLVVDGHTEGVLFTSGESSPAAGDWNELYLGYHVDDGSSLHGLTLEYAGGGTYAAGAFFYYNQTDPVSVTSSTFQYNEGSGLYLYSYATPEITDSTFRDNETYGIYADTYSGFGVSFAGNTITNNGSHPLAIYAPQAGQLDSSSTYAGNGTDTIRVQGGTISIDTTLQALDVPYQITGDVGVYGTANPLLTIDDGVSLYFDSNAGLFVGTSSTGNLQVDGDWASGDGVLFSTLDGTEAGIWDGIYIGYYSDSDTVMSGFTLEYAGTTSYPGGFFLYGAEPTFTDCLIQDNEAYGIYDYSSTVLSMSDCTVRGTVGTGSGNGDGVYIKGTIDTWSQNTLTDNDRYPLVLPADEMVELDTSSVLSGNGEDYVVLSSYYVGTSGTWVDLGVPYLVAANYLSIYGSAAVPVEIEADGIEMLFPSGSTYLYVGWSGQGELIATDSIFASAEASPAAGDWSGVIFGSYADASSITGSTVSHAGSSASYPGNINCYYCILDLTDSTLSDSLYYGIYATGTYTINTSGVTYVDNGSGDTYPDPL
jgi:hypothetical protein